MVGENLSRKDAAKQVGMTDQAVRIALRDNPLARNFYTEEVRSFVNATRHEAAHVLRNEMLNGTNAAARVSAARMFLEDFGKPAPPTTQPIPGLVVVIQQVPIEAPRPPGLMVDVTPARIEGD
jgi:hypothetical protein